MAEISLRITEQLVNGQKRSFRTGSDESKALVINLLSKQGIVGCLTLQFDDSGKPFIKLQREQGFDFQVCNFAQMKLQSYIGGENHVDQSNDLR